jgi:hypothetical protein
VLDRVRSRLTYSNTIATLALFVALGGASYAALSLPANSVGTRQIKNRAVTLRKISTGTRRALRGNRGPQGMQGGSGTPGRDGAAIVVRVRSTGSVETPADHSQVSVPLTSNTWSQAGSEVDFGPLGRLTYTAPSTTSCGGTGLADLAVEIDVDGKTLMSSTLQSPLDGATRTLNLEGVHELFEPGVAVTHTATVKVSSVCDAGSLPADFTVSDVEFDMIRAS